ncbi:hypothetical protein HYV69_02030 [Candidatus Uhrbacteria bacterium]|nr:hypothetical protein [Candidatus Uhrbacteria bacterium]
MVKLFDGPFSDSVEAVMKRLGYSFHCGRDGRPCFHRALNDPEFPRFHAYVIHKENGIEIDLHFDALDSIEHKGNHEHSWSYQGGRVIGEMQRITKVIESIKN